MQPNFDVFDHQVKVKVAETFGGLPPPGPTILGALPPKPSNPLSVAPKKHIVALNKLETLFLFICPE